MKKGKIKIAYRDKEYKEEVGYVHTTKRGNVVFVHKNPHDGWRVSDYRTGYLMCSFDKDFDSYRTRGIALQDFVTRLEDRFMKNVINTREYKAIIVNEIGE